MRDHRVITHHERFSVALLQRTSGVTHRYHCFGSDQREITTRIVTESGVQIDFPGAVAESLFPEIIGQEAEMTTNNECYYCAAGAIFDDPWRCIQNFELKVLSGKLAGQQFVGQRYWLDSIPSVGKD